MNAGGFAYVEVVVAALMLALFAMPAADAIKNSLDANRVSATKAAELRCVRNRMETVLAEPYLNLNVAAGTGAYNLAADTNCGALTVTIARKLFDGANLADLAATASDEQVKTALLTVQVTLDGSDYTFSTVVAR